MSGDRILTDTSGGTFTINLPATPAAGAFVVIADANDWSTTNLTVGRNGSTIEGIADDILMDVKGFAVEFAYDGSTWEIYTAIGLQGTQGTQGRQGIQGTSGPSTTINATDDTTTNATHYPVFVAAAGSNQTAEVSTTKLYFNPSTGDLSATNFNSLSDVTFKENFKTIDNSFDILEKINTYSFDWKDNKIKSYGVIAQELEKIMPELVKTNSNGWKTVAYTPLIAIIIDAVNKLKADIDNIKRDD